MQALECDLLGTLPPPLHGKFYVLCHYTLLFSCCTVCPKYIGRARIGRMARRRRVVLRDQLKRIPNPSLWTLRDATKYVCSWHYVFLQQHGEAYDDGTSPEKMPRLCMEGGV